MEWALVQNYKFASDSATYTGMPLQIYEIDTAFIS